MNLMGTTIENSLVSNLIAGDAIPTSWCTPPLGTMKI